MTKTKKELSPVYGLLSTMVQNATNGLAKLLWEPGQKTVVLAVMSEKGGVGKTAMTTALAAVAAAFGLRVLVIDFDPRATATDECGVKKPARSLNNLLYVDEELEVQPDITGKASSVIVPSGPGWPENVHVLAAKRGLGNREKDNTIGMELRLAMALEGVAEQYDLIVMDVPPRAGGKLVTTAFYAATHVIFPGTLNEDGRVGITDAIRSVNTLQQYHPRKDQGGVAVVGVVRNIVDRRPTNLSQIYDRRFESEFGGLLMTDTAIPKYTVREESRAARKPITIDTSAEGLLLQAGYIGVLNNVWKAA
jgi:chromosome partitioning protein